MKYQKGDIWFNTRSKKKYVLIDYHDNQVCFCLYDNPMRKFQLTEAQMGNVVRLDEECPPPVPKQLPEVPEFLKEIDLSIPCYCGEINSRNCPRHQ